MRQARQPKDVPPPLELECLKALWGLGEGSVREVRDRLQDRRPLAYTTVMTLLDRLARKGVVARRKQGRLFVYVPQVDRETMRLRAIADLAEALFDGKPALLGDYVRNGKVAENGGGHPPDEPAPLDASLL